MNREKESYYRRSVKEDGNWKIIDSGGLCSAAVIILNLERYSTDDNIFFIFILYIIYIIYLYIIISIYILYIIYIYIFFIYFIHVENVEGSQGEK